VSQLVAARGGIDLMPEQGTKPVNKYLPPRPRDVVVPDGPEPLKPVADSPTGWLGWLDRTLEKL
ncbi:MAG: (Fe-S)-binding protein, partial [Pseudomonadota bacterium]